MNLQQNIGKSVYYRFLGFLLFFWIYTTVDLIGFLVVAGMAEK